MKANKVFRAGMSISFVFGDNRWERRKAGEVGGVLRRPPRRFSGVQLAASVVIRWSVDLLCLAGGSKLDATHSELDDVNTPLTDPLKDDTH
ncbi:hypothetical protein PtB15_13B443 [Puccinia triticina]|nr:hypothetical protein PtB15_13B443 [Puccinia triticina]